MPKKILLYSLAGLLVFAIALQIYPFLVRAEVTKTDSLENLVSAELPGWIMEELELGQTEEVRNAVERRLRFDDVISRVYSQGNTQVGVYIAYWEPGTMPVRLVGVHTPDTCWVQNGWTCTDRESNVTKAVGGSTIKPAEFGVYEIETNRQHVLFWHLVGDRLHTYEQQGMHSLSAAFLDSFQYGLNQRQEQYFIRVSSNRPFNEIWDDPGIQQLMSDIAALGLKPAETQEPRETI